MKNAIIGGLVGALLVTGLVIIYLNTQRDLVTQKLVETTSTPSQMTSSPFPTKLPVQTSAKGSVSGKLCYPSSFLPKGAIEAKNTQTNEISSQEYIGSNAGGKSNYTMDLPVGTYIFRYKVGETTPATYGYHTTVCATGLETSCSTTNPRVHITVSVSAGSETNNIDLCDFYYGNNSPEF